MKTAEEWDSKSQLCINKNERIYRLAIYRECQLDAMKEGMRRAAKICASRITKSDFTIEATRCNSSILAAAEQLTEKDL